MAFDPKSLPSNVYKAYQIGAFNWMVVVEEAIKVQMNDKSELASIVFYLHHPERNGKPIAAHEVKEINQWKAFRTLIGARLSAEPKENKALPMWHQALTTNDTIKGGEIPQLYDALARNEN